MFTFVAFLNLILGSCLFFLFFIEYIAKIFITTKKKGHLMKKTLLPLLIFTATLFANDSNLRVGIDIGQSRDDINVARLYLQKKFQSNLYENNYFIIQGYHEASLNHWNANEKNSINAIAYSPVFTLSFLTDTTIKPYFEAGIGLAYISHKHIDDREKSTNFQFEDRLGIGIKKDNINFHIRYMHYSNAGIKRPNNGIDIALVGFSYKF